jgi:hypothetical protein
MNRPLSSLAKAELNLRAGGDCWLWIVEIITSTQTLRFSEDPAGVTFGGNSYPYFPFNLNLPNDVEEGLPDGTLVLDHTDRTIYDAIVGESSPPTIRIGLVLGNQQTVTELNNGALAKYKITHREVDGDANTITLSCGADIAYDEVVPGDYFDQAHFLQLFIKQDPSKVTT